MTVDLIAECYIGFTKLLNDEMRAFDMKDSMIFDTLKVASLTKNGNASGTINAKATMANEMLGGKSSSTGDLFKQAFMSSKKK